MTKLSHLPWYWQAEWGLNACTCGWLALVWKLVCFGEKNTVFYYSNRFLFHVNSWHDIHSCESFLAGAKHAHMYLWCGFILQFITGQTVTNSIHPNVLPLCVLTTRWGESKNQLRQKNIQSMTICNIYAKSFIQQRHIPGLLAAPIIQIRNI